MGTKMPRSILVYDLLTIETEILFLKLTMETDVIETDVIETDVIELN